MQENGLLGQVMPIRSLDAYRTNHTEGNDDPTLTEKCSIQDYIAIDQIQRPAGLPDGQQQVSIKDRFNGLNVVENTSRQPR